jgi:lysophospholipase L1-like esterase
MHPHRTLWATVHRLRRPALAAVAALCLTSLLASPTPAVAAASSDAVLVVGDSLTVGAADFGGLRSKLEDAGFAPTISARTGRGVQWGLSVLRSSGNALPSTVVIALGTNDVASGRSTKSFGALVDDVMETVGDDRFVLWVNLDLDATTWGAEQAARFNRVLGEKANQHGNLAVADWQSFAADHDAWMASDFVHLNGKGYRQRANFYTWQLQAWT